MNYKNKIAHLIRPYVQLDIYRIENLIEIPPKPEMGDYTLPCFQLSTVMKKAPNIIAEELKYSIFDKVFEQIENLGPYLNFFVDKGIFIENTIEKILKEGNNYGASNIGKGKTVCVEYSSHNIAKAFHVRNLFITVLGNTLCRMFKKEGYNAVGINHLEWGIQLGKLITAYNRWINEYALEVNPIDELIKIYIKFHEEAEKYPALQDKAAENFRNLETGEKKAEAIWTKLSELSLMEFERVYSVLGVKFDSSAGGAFYNDKVKFVVDKLKEDGLLIESNGAQVVSLQKYNMPPCIVINGDEMWSPSARDIAAVVYRKKNYDFYKYIYLGESAEELHFKQIFKVLELAGYKWANTCLYAELGVVKLANRELFTRNGPTILSGDLFNEAIEKTVKIINENNMKFENKEEAAKKIGIGAVLFAFLKNSREKDIVFNWKEILSFEGETGSYVQYSYARGKRLLGKGINSTGNVDYSKLASKEEFELVKCIANFNNILTLALDKLEPSIVTSYIIEIAKGLNTFYDTHQVLNVGDEVLQAARLNLIKACLQVIKNGLELLGIDVVI